MDKMIYSIAGIDGTLAGQDTYPADYTWIGIECSAAGVDIEYWLIDRDGQESDRLSFQDKIILLFNKPVNKIKIKWPAAAGFITAFGSNNVLNWES